MSSEIQRRTERTLMFNVFAIAESVEPVINMEINICRRGSVSLLTEVMIGTAASTTFAGHRVEKTGRYRAWPILGGVTMTVGALALTTIGLANLIGTYIAGQSARFMEKRKGLSFIYFGRCFIFLGLLFLPITPAVIIGLSALLGLLWLSTVPLTSSLVATFFGTRWMSMLFGVVFLSHQVGSFTGLWLAGYLFDRTKSYDAMWWISIALGLFAAAVHWPIKERPVPRLAMVSAA